MDLMSFTGEMSRLQKGGSGGNINLSMNSDDPLASLMGNGNSNGIKTIWGGGINYNNIIGNNTDFTSNYFYNRYNPHQESTVQRHYFLPDSSYFYNQHSISDNLNNSHRLNTSADIRLDSFNSIKISPSIGYQETRNSSYSDYQTLSEDGKPANAGFSNNYSTGKGSNFRVDALYRKKFHRKGRTFSLSAQASFNNTESNGSLLSVNHFTTVALPCRHTIPSTSAIRYRAASTATMPAPYIRNPFLNARCSNSAWAAATAAVIQTRLPTITTGRTVSLTSSTRH